MTRDPSLLNSLRRKSNLQLLLLTSFILCILSGLGWYLGHQVKIVHLPDWQTGERLAFSTEIHSLSSEDTVFFKPPWGLELIPGQVLEKRQAHKQREELLCRWPFRAGVNLRFERPPLADTSLSLPPGNQGRLIWQSLKDSLRSSWKDWHPKASAYSEMEEYFLVLSYPNDTLCIQAQEISLSLQTF